MTKAINKQFFPDHKPKPGESVLGRVTCYTCHQGESHAQSSTRAVTAALRLDNMSRPGRHGCCWRSRCTRRPALAQLQLARIEGVFLDVEGQPIAAAAIHLTDPLGGTLDSQTSDDTGRFVFPGVAPGRYALRASAPGHDSLTYPVTIDAGAAARHHAAISAAHHRQRDRRSAAGA